MFITDISVFEQIVLASNDPQWNYQFAKNIPGADMKKHEQVVLESLDPKWNYYYAKNIPGADIEAHAKVIHECTEPSEFIAFFDYWYENEYKNKKKKRTKIYCK